MKYLSLFSCILLTACAPESFPEEEAFDCIENNTFCASLEIPEDYDGNPRELFIGLYQELPPAGPPDAQLNPVASPTIIPGETYKFSRADVEYSTLTSNKSTLEGKYFVYFVIYDVNSDSWSPSPGLDYVAETNETYTFTGAPVEIGPLQVELSN